jgi:hypothetical protein
MNVPFARTARLRPGDLGLRGAAAIAALALTAGCSDPTSFSNSKVLPPTTTDVNTPMAPEQCAGSADWLPANGGPPPAQQMFEPLPHPSSECPFYRGGWQNFLTATHLDANGDPAIASLATIDDLFALSPDVAPPGQHRGTPKRAWLGVVKQAGARKIAVDQDGHTLFYGIHVNQAFVDFVTQNALTSGKAVQDAPPQLFFPEGVVEFKTAWKDIDMGDGISQAANADFKANYVTTKAWVPHLLTDANGLIQEDPVNNIRQIEVALVAMHVVYTFPGHPEFVWTSFEHVDLNGTNANTHALGRPDTAPVFTTNPTLTDPNNQKIATPVSMDSLLLYKGGTAAQSADNGFADSEIGFNEATQTFANPTNIYRMFPGSKSNSTNPDDAVAALNGNMTALFQTVPNDVRGHYRLLGGTWLDKPSFFVLDSDLQNDETSPLLAVSDLAGEAAFATISQDDERSQFFSDQAKASKPLKPTDDIIANGSDSAFSLLGGEDRMSSTSMESFTQGGRDFNNCLTCHNTQPITPRGITAERDTGAAHLLEPKFINVSHVFSELILLQCGPLGMCTQ